MGVACEWCTYLSLCTRLKSCGVKLQKVLSGLDKKAKTLDIHMNFCGFSQHSFNIFFLSTWGVIRFIEPSARIIPDI